MLVVDDKNASCQTVEALKHLLQSDSDITIDTKSGDLSYKKGLKVKAEIVQGTIEKGKPKNAKSIYFDIALTCESKKDLQAFASLLRSIRKVTKPILASPSAFQVLWDDTSTHYANLAYPYIASAENLMRKLITKFMHINVGITWFNERVPDDVQKSVNASNIDTTYLYNVDFIKLKDILLSESYAKDRDALLEELKTSSKASFKRDEIEALIPKSNWDKYFSTQVAFDSEELSSLWTRLYDLRCKVAHNKTFSLADFDDCKELTKKINPILNQAIEKLDDIHINTDEVENIVDEVVSNAVKEDNVYPKIFLREIREITNLVFHITTPLQPERPEDEPRKLIKDLRILLDAEYISRDQYKLFTEARRIRNNLVHHINDSEITEDWDTIIKGLRALKKSLTLINRSQKNKKS